ncbi:hypothetical protein Ddye_007435 [Dipteronia dyeriana]|uniref:Uncharacterized protein n=1 Tax=Dipteronia dyeriana TaxID=168575 RepID=A0AAD9XKJ3_9ROSI|nr:hypothetical protein Ddye_007435 [Dipteronia dyeriana]
MFNDLVQVFVPPCRNLCRYILFLLILCFLSLFVCLCSDLFLCSCEISSDFDVRCSRDTFYLVGHVADFILLLSLIIMLSWAVADIFVSCIDLGGFLCVVV